MRVNTKIPQSFRIKYYNNRGDKFNYLASNKVTKIGLKIFLKCIPAALTSRSQLDIRYHPDVYKR